MKKQSLCIILTVICLLITACGFSGDAKTPYLSQKERKKIVQNILKDCKVTLQGDYYKISITNNSKYDLWDFQLYDGNTSTTIYYEAILPQGATKVDSISAALRKSDIYSNDIGLYYTIGDFSYAAFNINLPTIKDAEKNPAIKIFIETKQGKVDLKPDKSGIDGSGIHGLSTATISSISCEYNVPYNNTYHPWVYINGKGPSGDNIVVYKLLNEDDVIVDIDQIYSMSDEWVDETIFFDNLKPGTYTLVFEEFS